MVLLALNCRPHHLCHPGGVYQDGANYVVLSSRGDRLDEPDLCKEVHGMGLHLCVGIDVEAGRPLARSMLLEPSRGDLWRWF